MSTTERKPTLDELIADADGRFGEPETKTSGNPNGPKPPVRELER